MVFLHERQIDLNIILSYILVSITQPSNVTRALMSVKCLVLQPGSTETRPPTTHAVNTEWRRYGDRVVLRF